MLALPARPRPCHSFLNLRKQQLQPLAKRPAAMADRVVTLEQAKSGRSTCRASEEVIAKGEWRVGFETWISGRVAMAWMVRCLGRAGGWAC